MVQTKTGRLNASKPNMQNVPEELRSLVISRFANGVIVNFDYSQLEVCVQAYLAQSDKMIQDIKDGVDFHVKRLAYAEELTYPEVVAKLAMDTTGQWKAKRRAAKTVSFQKAYGAHPEKIAKETHLPVETIERIFAEEDREYPEIAQFNKTVEESIRRTRVPTTNPLPIRDKDTGIYITRAHEAQGVGYYQSITGKRYHFLEKASTSEKLRHTDRDPFRYFSGPEIANYPTQGTAADIVALSVGRVWRLINHPGIKLINEVHDSLVLDVDYSVPGIETRIAIIQTTLEDVKGTFKHYLNIAFNCPIKVDVQISKSWGGNEDD
jgi:DNA polymerase I-like protein with 3'-5' exonuclease and polymerase domains